MLKINTKKIPFLLHFFLHSLMMAQTRDCNLDTNCVRMVLTGKTIGWKLQEIKGVNWEGSECQESTDFYFEFKKTGDLNIYQKTFNCKNEITKNKFLVRTNYKIVKLNSFGQLAVRIYKFHPDMQSFLYQVVNKNEIKNFVDFQFLYIKDFKHDDMLILRANSDLKQSRSIENKFK